MDAQNTLIVGAGYVGMALCRRVLQTATHSPMRLYALRRSPPPMPLAVGLHVVRADINDPNLAAVLPAIDFSAVVFCAAPDVGDATQYQRLYVDGAANLIAALRARPQRCDRFVFVSSTSVYAQSDGAWVDEHSLAAATDYRGATLLRAEAQVAASGLPHSIVRFGGIYGPSRLRLLRSVYEQTFAWPRHATYTNRIHRDDAAAALAHVCEMTTPQGLYLGVDCEPADKAQVLRDLHGLLGMAVDAPFIATDVALGKRCRNQKLLRSGFRFAYPTYREGYAQLVRDARAGLV